MRKAASGALVPGLLMIISAGILVIRSKMMEDRPSERLRELGKAWRSLVVPVFWIGVLLLFLALVFFILSFV